MKEGAIKVEPYDRRFLGSNSYDVHLGHILATYQDHILDAREHNRLNCFEIPDEGYVLYPHIFYMGTTVEYTETHKHVPFLEGKSSTGRLGIDIHATAGKGDVGFCGNWTLEISVKQPVKIYKGMPIGQLIYFPVDGEVENPYNTKKDSKYANQPCRPVETMMWKNFYHFTDIASHRDLQVKDKVAKGNAAFTVAAVDKESGNVTLAFGHEVLEPVHYSLLKKMKLKDPKDL